MKAREGILISVKLRREELQRYEAVEPGVFGFIYDTHPAAADPFHDSIVGDG